MKVIISLVVTLAVYVGGLFATPANPTGFPKNSDTVQAAYLMNTEWVHTAVERALAAECVSLSGNYSLHIQVDASGRYLGHESSPPLDSYLVREVLSRAEFTPARSGNRKMASQIHLLLKY